MMDTISWLPDHNIFTVIQESFPNCAKNDQNLNALKHGNVSYEKRQTKV